MNEKKFVKCPLCGKQVKGGNKGLGPHMRWAHGKLAGKKSKRQQTELTACSSKILKIPCSLGGHDLFVRIELKIESATIVDE